MGARSSIRHGHLPGEGPGAQSANLRGIVFMTLACASFACGDTIMKLSAGRVPTSELIFVRGCFVTGGAFLIALWLGALSTLHRALSVAMAARSVGDVAGAWSFQIALARMPYADLISVSQLTPLTITAASAIFLGERVGWRRWAATAAGLLGVLLIIRPGTSAFNWWALVGIGSVLGATLRDLATRHIDRSVPAPVIMMLSATAVTLSSLVVAPFADWTWPPGELVLAMAGAGLFSLLGQICVITSVRSGDISAVAPFRYTIIVFAIASGVLVFGHLPDALGLVGTAIIVAAGLYTFYREQGLQKAGKLERP